MPKIGRSNANSHQFIFVGGLHRSGTTFLQRTIASHPLVSGFHDTGAFEDEGQFLQKIYPVDAHFGGPGVFGLHPDARLTETSSLITAAKSGLFDAWKCHWDLTKPYLIEKTPGNLIRSRFLQEIFPNSVFIFIVRHPVACVLATLKMQKTAPVRHLFKNWIVCNDIMINDLPYLRRKIVIRYEELCKGPRKTVDAISNIIGLDGRMTPGPVEKSINQQYFAQWRDGDYRLWAGTAHWKAPFQRWRNFAERAYISRRYERDINELGYSFDVSEIADDLSMEEATCETRSAERLMPSLDTFDDLNAAGRIHAPAASFEKWHNYQSAEHADPATTDSAADPRLSARCRVS